MTNKILEEIINSFVNKSGYICTYIDRKQKTYIHVEGIFTNKDTELPSLIKFTQTDSSLDVWSSVEELLDHLEVPKWQRMNIFWMLERFDLASTQDHNQQISIFQLPNGEYCFTLAVTWIETVVNNNLEMALTEGFSKVTISDED